MVREASSYGVEMRLLAALGISASSIPSDRWATWHALAMRAFCAMPMRPGGWVVRLVIASVAVCAGAGGRCRIVTLLGSLTPGSVGMSASFSEWNRLGLTEPPASRDDAVTIYQSSADAAGTSLS